jgi:hypothetical protein
MVSRLNWVCRRPLSCPLIRRLGDDPLVGLFASSHVAGDLKSRDIGVIAHRRAGLTQEHTERGTERWRWDTNTFTKQLGITSHLSSPWSKQFKSQSRSSAARTGWVKVRLPLCLSETIIRRAFRDTTLPLIRSAFEMLPDQVVFGTSSRSCCTGWTLNVVRSMCEWPVRLPASRGG